MDTNRAGIRVNRTDALEIADRLWEIVNRPPAGPSDPDSLALVERLTSEIRNHPDLSVNLKLKADEVAYHCRLLFDEEAFSESSHSAVDVVAALARNAIIKLRLVAESRLPPEPREPPAAGRATVPAGRRAGEASRAHSAFQFPVWPLAALRK